ncbi:LADA_0B00738g1_1 [Lachancea dasiensis]|uniref:LADA_0B00738g1_1 n=1 Tax=Lachancea dasiensis TaxID=1072105 RepID=A0A1G4IRJ0_9SACH|nr:LADA_0B00738g1_1 [Lachancea dasiensis]
MNITARRDTGNENHNNTNLKDAQSVLEAKKRALLRSIAERKQKAQNDRLKTEAKDSVLTAVEELVRLGFSFDSLSREPLLSKEFLKEAFEESGRTVSIMETNSSKVNTTFDHVNPVIEPVQVDTPAPLEAQLLPTAEPAFKRRSVNKSPVWLQDLVIDLTSSGDDDDTANSGEIDAPHQSHGGVLGPANNATAINIGSEVSRLTMRLKIEISRLRQRLKACQSASITENTLKVLLDKKEDMIQDIESLFLELEARKERPPG